MRDDFDERRSEVEQYFDYLEKIDDGSHRLVRTDGSPAYPASTHVDLLKTFKANGFILLYNLLESTVKNAIESIFDDLQNKAIDFDACRGEVRRIVLSNLKRRNVDDLLPRLQSLAVDVIATTFRKEELFAGNVDARAVRKAARGYGFSHPSKKSDLLVVVKTNRNDLAHGNKSFADVGRDYDVQRLVEIKNEVVEYLEELIANIETYIANQGYLLSAV